METIHLVVIVGRSTCTFSSWHVHLFAAQPGFFTTMNVMFFYFCLFVVLICFVMFCFVMIFFVMFCVLKMYLPTTVIVKPP